MSKTVFLDVGSKVDFDPIKDEPMSMIRFMFKLCVLHPPLQVTLQTLRQDSNSSCNNHLQTSAFFAHVPIGHIDLHALLLAGIYNIILFTQADSLLVGSTTSIVTCQAFHKEMHHCLCYLCSAHRPAVTTSV